MKFVEPVLSMLFPPRPIMHPLDDMSSSLCYHKRMSRGQVEVESEASRAVPMKLVADQGKFKGYGYFIKQVDE